MTDSNQAPPAAPLEAHDSAAAPEAASAPAAPADPEPSETPRRSFHLLLGTVLLPYYATVIAWAIAWAFAVFWRRRATGAEARRWARRILALAVIDTLVAVAPIASLFAEVGPPWSVDGSAVESPAAAEDRPMTPSPAQEPDGVCAAAPSTETLAPFTAVLALLGVLAVFTRGARAGLGWTAASLVGGLGGSFLAASGACALVGRASGANEVLTLWGSSLGLGAVAALGLRRVRTGDPAAPAAMRWTSALGLACWYTLTGGARLGILLAAVFRATADGAVPADEMASLVQGVAGTHWLALLAVPVVVLAPVGEELAFRGLLQPALARRWGQGAAIAVSAILFAALHWHYGMKLPLVVFLGAVLGWARAASGGLRAPILLHMIMNGLSLLVLSRGGR